MEVDPRIRLHLIRFHGVLAPNAKLHAILVPQGPERPAQAAPPAECKVNCMHHSDAACGSRPSGVTTS
jgi:hypothetical protein